MTIIDKTLTGDIWTDIRTTLVASSILVDSKFASIQANYADIVDGNGSARKPYVILHPVGVEESKDKFGSNQGRKLVNVFIDCIYTNTKYVDSLADQVAYSLSENNIAGIELIGITSDYAFTDPNQKKYHEKNLTFTYLRE